MTNKDDGFPYAADVPGNFAHRPAGAQAGVAELAAQWRAEAAGWMALLTPPGVPDNPGDDILRERIKRLNACADALAALGGKDG